jgi:hypothetical protein
MVVRKHFYLIVFGQTRENIATESRMNNKSPLTFIIYTLTTLTEARKETMIPNCVLQLFSFVSQTTKVQS